MSGRHWSILANHCHDCAWIRFNHSTTVSTFLIPTHIITISENYTLFVIRPSMGYRVCPSTSCIIFFGSFLRSPVRALPWALLFRKRPSHPGAFHTAFHHVCSVHFQLGVLYTSRGVVSMLIVRLSHFSLFPISGLQVVCPPQPVSVTLRTQNRSIKSHFLQSSCLQWFPRSGNS
jgi:hypothetical protein